MMKGRVELMEQDGRKGFLATFGSRSRFYAIEEWGEAAASLARSCQELWQKGVRPNLPDTKPRPEKVAALVDKIRSEIEGGTSPGQAEKPRPATAKGRKKVPGSAKHKKEDRPAPVSHRQSKPGRVQIQIHAGGEHYVASYYPEPGKRVSKMFSIETLGRDEAFQAACRQRKRWETALHPKPRT
jgi:hypothetical protein